MPTIIFDAQTYITLVKACIMEFFDKDSNEADFILENASEFSTEYFPPKEYNRMALLDHQTPYDVAFSIIRDLDETYQNKFEPITIDAYYEWEADFIQKHQLNEEYISYLA